jgi:hypothetical protein
VTANPLNERGGHGGGSSASTGLKVPDVGGGHWLQSFVDQKCVVSRQPAE